MEGARNAVPTAGLIPGDNSMLGNGTHILRGSLLSATVEADVGTHRWVTNQQLLPQRCIIHSFPMIPKQCFAIDIIIVPMLQMWKLRPREIKQHVPGQKAFESGRPRMFSLVPWASSPARLTFILNRLKENITTSFFTIWLLEPLAQVSARKRISENGPHRWRAAVCPPYIHQVVLSQYHRLWKHYTGPFF